MKFLPADIQVQILKSLVDSGHTFLNLVLASRSFYDIYSTYRTSLDLALIASNPLDECLPFAWLLAQELEVDGDHQEETWGKRVKWKKLREAWLSMEDSEFDYERLVTTIEQKRKLHKIHSLAKATVLHLDAMKISYNARLAEQPEPDPELDLGPFQEGNPIPIIFGYTIVLMGFEEGLWSEWQSALSRRVEHLLPYSIQGPHPEELPWEFCKVASERILSAHFIDLVMKDTAEYSYDGEEEYSGVFIKMMMEHFTKDLEHLYRFTQNHEVEKLDKYQRDFISK